MLHKNGITLGTISRDSIRWMQDQRNNPVLRQYFREWKDISSYQQNKWYESLGNNSNDNHVYFQMLIENTLVGCCGLLYIDWRLRSAELSFFVARGFGSRDFKEKALTMLLDYGFNQMRLHKVWAEVYDTNPDINLYREVCKFTDDGISRHSYLQNGNYRNSVIMSVLENEWRER